MSVYNLQQLTIDLCLNCRGIWFDRGELNRLGPALASGSTTNASYFPSTVFLGYTDSGGTFPLLFRTYGWFEMTIWMIMISIREFFNFLRRKFRD